MGDDVGYTGAYSPMVVGEGTLNELRNLAGPAPVQGKHWVMVDLKNGEFKWYQSTKRRGGNRGGYGRAPWGPNYGGRRRY